MMMISQVPIPVKTARLAKLPEAGASSRYLILQTIAAHRPKAAASQR
jgi:hypothetical protein